MPAEMRALLERRMTEKVEELTVAIPAALGGSLSQAEYYGLIERQRELGREIQRLGLLLAGLVLVGPGMIPPDRVGFGSRVAIEDLRSGEVDTYTLLSGELLDLIDGQISIHSPVGAALLGRRAGDEVRVTTPGGERRIRLLRVHTLPEQLSDEYDDQGRSERQLLSA